MTGKSRVRALVIATVLLCALLCVAIIYGRPRRTGGGGETGGGGAVAANCSISYAKSYDSPQAYIDGVKPDLVAKATLGEPRLSMNGRTVSFTAHLLDVKSGDDRAGDDVTLDFECGSVASFMPDGYETGDEVIVLANDSRLRQPESVWPFDEQTYDSLTTQ